MKFPSNLLRPRQNPFLFVVFIYLSVFANCADARTGTYSLNRTSLSEYKTKAVAIKNPVNLLSLPPGSTYQITHSDFILQFFFNSNNNIIGMILKRDPNKSIHVRWCFYRSCEENRLDYNATIANVRDKPFQNGFFEIKLPAQFDYHFQGLHFTSGK